MKSQLHYLGAVALVYLASSLTRAEPPQSGPGTDAPMTGQIINASVPITAPAPSETGLSSWIIGTDPDCCGPLSDRNPLRTELYFRSGVVFPFGDGQLADSLHTGWSIGGGVRTLCFDNAGTAAWAFDLGLTNVYNGSAQQVPDVALRNVTVTVGQLRFPIDTTAQVASLNRTSVNLGIGREWYLFGSASGTRDSDGAHWRIGLDGGGRYGSAKAQFREFRHLTDVIGGTYAAVHSDLDFDCGCCTFFAGIRGEWNYTWSDILQIQNKSDVQDISVLVNVGVRY